MKLAVVGCNHRIAPLPLRERMAFDPPAVAAALDRFKIDFPDAEAVLLSTCNRTELYVARPLHARPRIEEAQRWLAAQCGLAPAELSGRMIQDQEAHAVRRLFRVASGLDSMALGESQIGYQARAALAQARAAGTAGPALGALFERAFAAARDVRRRAGIGRGRFSLGGVALDVAQRVFPRLDDKTVLMIGAGRMGQTTLRHFLSQAPGRTWLTSRSDDRTRTTARRLGVEPRAFARVEEWVAEADVVVSCAAAARPLLTRERLEHVPARRRYRTELFVDLGVPRSIDPRLRDCEGFLLYDLDDLDQVAEKERERRRGAAEEGERLIETHVEEFLRDRARREAGPIIAAFRRHLEAVAEREFDWLAPKLGPGGRADAESVRHLLHRIMGKVLHAPTVRLNELSREGKAEAYDRMLRKLFDLPAERD